MKNVNNKPQKVPLAPQRDKGMVNLAIPVCVYRKRGIHRGLKEGE